MASGWQRHPRGFAYGLAVLSSVAALLLSRPLVAAFGGGPVLLIFLAPIGLSAYVGGWGPGLTATGLAALFAGCYLLPPWVSLRILNAQEGLRWGFLIGLGLLVSVLSEGWHRFRRRAEDSRRRFAVTLGSISDAVITTDSTGRITLCNAAAERLTGWTEREAAGQSLAAVVRLLSADSRRPEEDPVRRAHREGVAAGAGPPVLLVARDGREMLIELTSAPIQQAGGEIIGVAVVFRDATAKQLAEKAGRAQADQFNQLLAQTRCILSIGEVTGPEGWRERALGPVSPFHWEFPVQDEASAQAVIPLELAAGERYHEAWIRSRPATDQAQMDRNAAAAFLSAAPFFRNEFRCRDKSGGEHWMQQYVTVRPQSENRWQVFGITTDITDLKKGEEGLRESEARFRSYVEHAPLVVLVVDRTGRIVDCNPAAIQMLGDDRNPLRGRSVPEILAGGEPELVRRALTALAEQKPLEGEFALRSRAGKVIWVWLRAVVMADGRWLGFCQDITEGKQAKERQTRLATAVEQAAEDILITDAGGKILYVNPAFERISGYAPGEVLGGNPRLLKSGKHDPVFYQKMWATLHRGEVWSGRLINKRKDGALYEVEGTIAPIRDAAGQIISYVGVRRDVTHEAASEAQFRQGQKLEAIGQLAAGIAHEYNNLLMAIRGNASLLLLGTPPPSSEIAGFAQQIVEATERAAHLTRQLLIFGRQRVIQPVRLDLSNEVAHMAKLLPHILGEQIAMTTRLTPGLPPILADPGMIEHILLNLAVNSRDAMPQGGQMSITTDLELPAAETAGNGRPGGAGVRLTVTDTGCGIAPEDLPHIFEPFFTTKGAGKGTGLGLAIVHGMVQQHQGRIAVTSEPGRGTTFQIYFPALPDQPAEAPAAPKPAKLPRGTETLLVVEDEDMVRLAVTRMLQRFGYAILQAGSGEEALQIWRQNQERIQLVLTDIVMPGMTGFELARQLQSEQPALTIIYTSGYIGDLADQGVTLTEGVNFLPKPYEPRKLAAILRENLGPGRGED